ncbi:hypothetical protein AM587_10005859 [Phytophthora nicotianae]|uniref:PDZ domain-containing protein n=1 Tax=Phytophthora nicotianae TaxID=4792 RepID=A0A0W8CUM1_PHYNI|nr:hypothetical protein AM587_10005859 [Phytophthora nicotianae]
MEALAQPVPMEAPQDAQQEQQTQPPVAEEQSAQNSQQILDQQAQEQQTQVPAQVPEGLGQHQQSLQPALPQPQQPQQIPQPPQQQNFVSSGYDAASMNPVAASQQMQMPQQFQPQQQYNPLYQQYNAQQQQYNPQQPPQQQQMNAYNLKAPSTMAFGASSAPAEERATHLLAACESCLVVTRIPGVDMSFRRIMERKCPRCGGTLVLPQEVMEMLILYGNFVPESAAVTLVLGTMVLHPSLRADFMAAAMNDLLTPLQTDFVYDVAVPKRPDGLGMSLRMNQGNLVVGGFIDFENNQESPSVAARIIAVDDILVAINKKSITSWTFEKSISMLAHAASPVYLTFRRRQPVMLL